jgi:hypothetical protein
MAQAEFGVSVVALLHEDGGGVDFGFPGGSRERRSKREKGNEAGDDWSVH